MRKTLIACLFFVSATVFVFADTVYLNDGRVVKGKVIKEDESEVVVESKLGTVTFKREEVDRIVRGDDEETGREELPKKEEPPSKEPSAESPKTENPDDLVKQYLEGNGSVFEKLKEKGDAAVISVKKAMKKASDSQKTRLKKLFDELTKVSEEKQTECEKWYKEGVNKEGEWWKTYDGLRKQGLSQKQAVNQTAKELAETIQCFQKAVDANKWYEDGMLRLGVMLYQAHLFEKAIEALKLLIEAEDDLALKTAGAAAFSMRDYKKCASYLEKYSDEKDADTLLMLIQSYLYIPDTTKAETAIKRLEKLMPDDYRVFACYGCLYLLKKRFNDSVNALKKAIEKGDKTAGTRLNLASALDQLGKTEEAIVYCEEALKLAPGDYSTLLLLASLYTKVGRYDDAIKVLEEFLKLYPNSQGAPGAREALKKLKERKK